MTPKKKNENAKLQKIVTSKMEINESNSKLKLEELRKYEGFTDVSD